MAEITSSDFKKLIEAQKETTRQVMTAEERAADDAKRAEQSRLRSEAALKGHQTRLANQRDINAEEIANDSQQQAKQIESQSASADAESESEQFNRDKQVLGFLKQTAGFLGGIAKQGTEKVKSGLSGFKKFAFGALALAALAFLNSPFFDKTLDIFQNKILPILTKLYTKVLKPLFLFLKGKFITAFEDIEKFLDGEINAFELLWNNKLVVAGLIGAFAPSLFLAPLKMAGSLALKGLSAGATKGAITSLLAKSGIGAVLGPMAILGGVLLAVKDGIAGIDMAKEIGVDKFSGFIGGLFGGLDSGFSGMFSNMGKFALIGAGIGSFIPVVGTLIGGAIGALIGGVLGYIGGERIARAVQKITDMIKNFFTESILKVKDFLGIDLTEEEQAQLDAMRAKEEAEEVERKAAEEERIRQRDRINRIEAIETAKANSARVLKNQEERLLEAEAKAAKNDEASFLSRLSDGQLKQIKQRRKAFEETKAAEAERLKLLDEEKAQIQAEINQTEERLRPANGVRTAPNADKVGNTPKSGGGDANIDARTMNAPMSKTENYPVLPATASMSGTNPIANELATVYP